MTSCLNTLLERGLTGPGWSDGSRSSWVGTARCSRDPGWDEGPEEDKVQTHGLSYALCRVGVQCMLNHFAPRATLSGELSHSSAPIPLQNKILARIKVQHREFRPQGLWTLWE